MGRGKEKKTKILSDEKMMLIPGLNKHGTCGCSKKKSTATARGKGGQPDAKPTCTRRVSLKTPCPRGKSRGGVGEM